jgi:hypothetical protein
VLIEIRVIEIRVRIFTFDINALLENTGSIWVLTDSSRRFDCANGKGRFKTFKLFKSFKALKEIGAFKPFGPVQSSK